MNDKQKISLLIGILSGVFWLVVAGENPLDLFEYMDEWFDDWWQGLSFAIAIAGLSGFFLFKDKK